MSHSHPISSHLTIQPYLQVPSLTPHPFLQVSPHPPSLPAGVPSPSIPTCRCPLSRRVSPLTLMKSVALSGGGGIASYSNLNLHLSYFEWSWACFDGFISYLGHFSLGLLVFFSLIRKNLLYVTRSGLLWNVSDTPTVCCLSFYFVPPSHCHASAFYFYEVEYIHLVLYGFWFLYNS